MKRVGLLGGTFSPPHIGHLMMAKTALSKLHLDEVILIPCGYPPHKDINNILPSDLRLKMTQILVEKEKNISVSDIEIKNEGRSYTANTLEMLKADNKDTVYFFIVGADSLCYMDKWMTPEIIFKNADIAVIDRVGFKDKEVENYIKFLEEKYGARINRVPMQKVDISSSKLREMLINHEDISRYTNEEIYNLIKGYFK